MSHVVSSGPAFILEGESSPRMLSFGGPHRHTPPVSFLSLAMPWPWLWCILPCFFRKFCLDR